MGRIEGLWVPLQTSPCLGLSALHRPPSFPASPSQINEASGFWNPAFPAQQVFSIPVSNLQQCILEWPEKGKSLLEELATPPSNWSCLLGFWSQTPPSP